MLAQSAGKRRRAGGMPQRQPRRSPGEPRRPGRAPLILAAAALGIAVLQFVSRGASFVPAQRSITRAGPAPARLASSVPAAAAVRDDVVNDVLSAASAGLLPGERFVVMNRFEVREDAEAKFEQRWATRKSSLLEFDGFRWFSLLRRVSPPGEEADYEYPDDVNYQSFTVFDTKDNFNAWRKGPAFKEAHGFGNILGFVTTVMEGFMTAKGPPKPAFWEGTLVQKAAEQPRALPRPDSDGTSLVKPDVFISMNRFSVVDGREDEFEGRWASRESRLEGLPGFRAFQMLRRDQVPDDDINYMSMAVWDDRAAFENWRNGEGFKQAHKSRDDAESAPSREGPMGGVLQRPPKPYFYEGKLVVQSEQGL